jgi:hypothetical protein
MYIIIHIKTSHSQTTALVYINCLKAQINQKHREKCSALKNRKHEYMKKGLFKKEHNKIFTVLEKIKDNI